MKIYLNINYTFPVIINEQKLFGGLISSSVTSIGAVLKKFQSRGKRYNSQLIVVNKPLLTKKKKKQQM